MEPFRRALGDVLVCVWFYTRLPLPGLRRAPDFGRASWASPLAGALVGGIGGAVFSVAAALGLAPALAGLLAVGTTIAVTGALHEDGLSDMADGFGGGRSRERKLDIMRDSRIGTFGACTLILSVALRAGALASLAAPALVATALIAAHAAARASLPAFMRFVPPARSDGLSAGVGVPPRASVAGAGGLGLGVLFLGFDAGTALMALALAVATAAAIAGLCRRQIGGQTGDVLGGLEQSVEIAILLVAAARLGAP